MSNANVDDEIFTLRQLKWKTNLSRNIEKFSEIINDEKVFNKYFGEQYVDKLTQKSKELLRNIIKLGLIYTVLMLSLFASQNISNSEFEVFGFGFKNLGNYKEFLLFLAAVISPISAILVAYQKYINALIKECIKKLIPDDNIRKFYTHIYIDEYSDGLINIDPIPSNSLHGFSVFMMVSFVLVLIFLFLTLLAGSFLIQINVIYDVATKPSSSHYINLFVIIFSITSILFSWIVSIIQLPMPEIDRSNYYKLSKIKDEDPEKYQDIMIKLGKESSKKEERSSLISHTIIYTITFSAIAIRWYPDSLINLSYFLEYAMPGAFIVIFSAYIILKYIRKQGLSWLFRKYPNSTDERLQIYSRMEKIFLLIKIVIPIFMSTAYAFYALSH
ncbi:MAG: hypothetical protein PHW18_11145 [Sulfuricurvum sp.]|uniref:hypothetical protein n=1 Tax=Sulfuricurvum sp. TaxID=2025608 RepID=UPI002625D272|nr:hypothetical protein [Sulfuricurvum sp.]MDD2830120.1 hypothetical protein [Sulfuricurvum sp.]MDD4949616.1 hypothetical protein [Sulfuricurvum sp.]